MTFISVEPGARQPITSKWGNTLPFRDAQQNLRPDAYRMIQAFMYFPNDPITAWALIDTLLLLDQTEDGTADEPALIKFCTNAAERAKQQMYVAAMIGSVLLVGATERKKISLRQAVAMVLEEINARPELKSFPKHEKNIRGCFSRFSPSLHFFLAEIALTEDEREQAQTTMQGCLHYLSAAHDIMALISTRDVIKDWKPWVVDPSFGTGEAKLEILGLSAVAQKAASRYRADPDRLGAGGD